MTQRCFGRPPPGLDLAALQGKLIVVEGPDSSGRSTQITLLSRWLEGQGYAVEQVGLKRSKLVAAELEQAKQGNVLSPRTMALFYATDFFDQFENRMVPALKAGSVVLSDRYVFTLMARDIVRGGDPKWLEGVYSLALEPDAVFMLRASVQRLEDHKLAASGKLDYWESGMDLGLSRDWHESFVAYQARLGEEFDRIAKQHGIETIDADRPVLAVHRELRERVAKALAK